ncbi:MAG: phosphate signaling complex protein PhoU [Desulfobacterales bacterium]|nr:phosphate signaling complex protein PhoU [Desulfobacterales bacterium]
MSIHLQHELENLKKRILSLGALVEQRVREAIQAIATRDADIAGKIIKSDFEIDEIEVEIEEECLKIMALHQPVAVDLRFIIAVIKINNDLERIGDEAVNIAQGVKRLAKRETRDTLFDFSKMAQQVEEMLKLSLDALVNLDIDLAFKVLTMDSEVDDMNNNFHELVKKELLKHDEGVEYLISKLLISRHLERIADHATNIAEEVVYMIEGEIVRHENY